MENDNEGQLTDNTTDVNPFEKSETGSPGERYTQPQQEEPKAAEAAPVQQQQPVWDGQQWSLKYKGNPYVPKSRDDLINLAQKGFGYSQEMEKIKRERQEFEQKQKQYTQYEQFDQLLKSNPALAQRIAESIQQQQPQQEPEQSYQLPPEVYSKIEFLEQEAKQRRDAEQDRILDNELQSLKSKYSQHQWDTDDGSGETLEKQLIRFALDNGIGTLEHAYRAMMFDQIQTATKADTLKQEAEKKKEAFKNGVVTNGQPAPVTAQTSRYSYGDSYNDLAKRMASELKI